MSDDQNKHFRQRGTLAKTICFEHMRTCEGLIRSKTRGDTLAMILPQSCYRKNL
jgi:hypothetical protein